MQGIHEEAAILEVKDDGQGSFFLEIWIGSRPGSHRLIARSVAYNSAQDARIAMFSRVQWSGSSPQVSECMKPTPEPKPWLWGPYDRRPKVRGIFRDPANVLDGPASAWFRRLNEKPIA